MLTFPRLPSDIKQACALKLTYVKQPNDWPQKQESPDPTYFCALNIAFQSRRMLITCHPAVRALS